MEKWQEEVIKMHNKGQKVAILMTPRRMGKRLLEKKLKELEVYKGVDVASGNSLSPKQKKKG